MAPTYNAVAVNVDEMLAHRAAAFLAKSGKPPKRVVNDLLERMRRVRLRRESLGLNHWEAYATVYLQRLVQRHESLRRRAVAAFFKAERAAAVARAERALGSREEADDAAGEAFLRLFAGKTRIPLFYRALKQVCLLPLPPSGASKPVVVPYFRFEFKREYDALYTNRHDRFLLRGEHVEALKRVVREYNRERSRLMPTLSASDIVNAALDFAFEHPVALARLGEPEAYRDALAREVYRKAYFHFAFNELLP